MSTKTFLTAMSVVRTHVRGKALANWKRPSIDELGVPTQSWTHVHNNNQKRFNVHLVAGVSFFTATLVFISATVDFNTTPKHLLK